MVFPKEFFEKVDFEKNQQKTENMNYFSGGQRVKSMSEMSKGKSSHLLS